MTKSTIKFFFTDPMEMAVPEVSLESASRVFISGTNLETQIPGLSEGVDYSSWGRLLAQALPCNEWMCMDSKGEMEKLMSFPVTSDFGKGIDRVFLGGSGTLADHRVILSELLNSDRRQMEPALGDALRAFDILVFPVVASAGFDLEVFTSFSIKEILREHLSRQKNDGLRRFFLDANKVRSEQKFHFDLWMLNEVDSVTWVEEV